MVPIDKSGPTSLSSWYEVSTSQYCKKEESLKEAATGNTILVGASQLVNYQSKLS